MAANYQKCINEKDEINQVLSQKNQTILNMERKLMEHQKIQDNIEMYDIENKRLLGIINYQTK